MNMKKVFIKYNTLSPISHMAPPAKGIRAATTQRMIKIVVDAAEGKKIERLPVVSGGSIRGKHRRHFVTKVLSELGYYQNHLLAGLRQETFEALIAGGRQVAKTEQSPRVEKFISTYSDLPFFGLFGGTPYSTFFEGRLSVGFAIPMLEETRYLFKISGSPYSNEEMPSYDKFETFLDRHTYTRVAIKNIAEPDEVDFSYLLTFLKEKGFELAAAQFEEDINEYNEKVLSTDEEKEPPKLKLDRLTEELKKDEALRKELGQKLNLSSTDFTPAKIIAKIINLYNLQMIYEVPNPIPAGLNLHSVIVLKSGLGDDKLMEATFDAFIETILEDRFLGGMYNRGYGHVITEAKTEDGQNFIETSNSKYFWDWLNKNKNKIKNILENLDKYLVTPPEK